MKSKEFLIEKLTEMSSKFEDVKIRYEYRKNTYSHIIEVIPLAIFNSDKEYMMAEADLEDEFETLFPKEDIVFISEDSLTEIESPDLLLGYESITFDNLISATEFVVEGFTDEVDFSGCEYYALAA
nr:hypothetical protein [uncultured Draconibacterium sp.]